MASERTRLVRASERRHETTQTPGMTRDEAVRTASLWAGSATTAGHTFSGWHHHGEYESVIYVLRGRVRLEYGAGGRDVIEAGPTDTLYVASGEINSQVTDHWAATEAVRRAFAGRPGAGTDDLDGLTVTSQDWWFNIRPSNTEPLLRLNVEATDEPTLAATRDEVLRIVRGG